MSNQALALLLEQLENRLMLSTVTIYAAGDAGGEYMSLQVDGNIVEYFEVDRGAQSGDFQTFTYETDADVTIDQIRIEFINDAYNPDAGIDRNLRIDAVEIDGIRFETEGSDVYSSGTWRSADGIVGGLGRGDTLHADGFFQYGIQSGEVTEIVIQSSEGIGAGNNETFELQIRGETVATYRVQDIPFTGGFDGPSRFTYIADGEITADDIRLEFINDDVYDTILKGLPVTIDRNLTIEYIQIDGVQYDTDSELVFASGVWRNGSITSGFGLGNTLHVNGYFQFSATGSQSTEVVIKASDRIGAGWGEAFELQIRGETVATYEVRDNPLTGGFDGQTEFTFTAPYGVSADDIRLVYFNDDVFQTSIKGNVFTVDRNLTIDWIRVDGIQYNTNAENVFASGVWVDGGVSAGLGLGNTLHTNGYFQFST